MVRNGGWAVVWALLFIGCSNDGSSRGAALIVTWDSEVCVPDYPTTQLRLTRGERATEVYDVPCSLGGRRIDFLDAVNEPWTLNARLLTRDGTFYRSDSWASINPLVGAEGPITEVRVALDFPRDSPTSGVMVHWRINGRAPLEACSALAGGHGTALAAFFLYPEGADQARRTEIRYCEERAAFLEDSSASRYRLVSDIRVGELTGVSPPESRFDPHDITIDIPRGEILDVYIDFTVTAVTARWTVEGRTASASTCGERYQRITLAAGGKAGAEPAAANCAVGSLLLSPEIVELPGTVQLGFDVSGAEGTIRAALPEVSVAAGEIKEQVFDLQDGQAVPAGALQVEWTLPYTCEELGASSIHFVLDDAGPSETEVPCALSGSVRFENVPPRLTTVRAWLLDAAQAVVGIEATGSATIPPAGVATARVALLATPLPVVHVTWPTSPACDNNRGESVVLTLQGVETVQATAPCAAGEASLRVRPGTWTASALLRGGARDLAGEATPSALELQRGQTAEVSLAFPALVAHTVYWTLDGFTPDTTRCRDELGAQASVVVRVGSERATATCASVFATVIDLIPGTLPVSVELLDSNGERLAFASGTTTVTAGAPATVLDLHPELFSTLEVGWTVDGSTASCLAGSVVSISLRDAENNERASTSADCSLGTAQLRVLAGSYRADAVLTASGQDPVPLSANVVLHPGGTTPVSFAFITPGVADVTVPWTVNGQSATSECGTLELGTVTATIGSRSATASCATGQITFSAVQAGTHDVSLSVVDGSGATVAVATRSGVTVVRDQPLTVQPPIDLAVSSGPHASFTLAWVNSRLRADASASTGNIVSYEWWFCWSVNSGPLPDVTTTTPTTNVLTEDTCTVRLRVTDASGAQDATTRAVPPRPQ